MNFVRKKYVMICDIHCGDVPTFINSKIGFVKTDINDVSFMPEGTKRIT